MGYNPGGGRGGSRDDTSYNQRQHSLGGGYGQGSYTAGGGGRMMDDGGDGELGSYVDS